MARRCDPWFLSLSLLLGAAACAAKPDLEVAASPGGTRVKGDGLDVVLDDATLVAVTQARTPPSPVEPGLAAALSLMP